MGKGQAQRAKSEKGSSKKAEGKRTKVANHFGDRSPWATRPRARMHARHDTKNQSSAGAEASGAGTGPWGSQHGS